MYLLNVRTMQLEQFDHPPLYAILSHRWQKEEVLFHDIGDARAHTKAGYTKIQRCCAQALFDGLDYVWMDTCCIDTSSSAVLCEALNSMHAWYRNAWVCYAYLHDVRSDEDASTTCATFRYSDWFRRGWTLQELLAPKRLFFFATDWTVIGSKVGLAQTIATITRIDSDALVYPGCIRSFSVAARMSWAAGRVTTKEEDKAYSLMGIFDVHMPIIYGEGGRKAFIRLQQEIIKTSNDQSVLAWQAQMPDGHGMYGPLANSPNDFRNCHNIHRVSPSKILCKIHDEQRFPQGGMSVFYRLFQLARKSYRRRASTGSMPARADFAMTNNGLNITLPLRPRGDGSFDALLSCCRDPLIRGGRESIAEPDHQALVCIHLWQPNTDVPHFVRVHDTSRTIAYDCVTNDFTLQEIHLGEWQQHEDAFSLSNFFPKFVVRCPALRHSGFVPRLFNGSGCTLTEEADGNVSIETSSRHIWRGQRWRAARILFHNPCSSRSFVITFGVSFDDNTGFWPWVCSHIGSDGEPDGDAFPESIIDWATCTLDTGQVVNATVRKAASNEPRCRTTDSLAATYLVTVAVRRIRER